MDMSLPEAQMASGLALVGVLATAALTAVLIVVLFPLLRRYALARPNARSSHTVPTPQGGGIAVVIVALATWLGGVGWTAVASWQDPQIVAVATAALALAVVGMIDDIRPIPAAPRLLLQAGAVALVMVVLPDDIRVVPAAPAWIERAAVGLGLVWFVNLVNFMDGIDWMSVAEVVPITACLAVLAALGALPAAGGLLAIALLGAMLGFAPFNRPVARLFLGDVGSLPIGLMTGWLLIVLAGRGHLAAALLLPLYYVADATLTLARRLVRRERVWEAHRTHFYQRAVSGGMSVRRVIGRVLAANLVLAGLAVVTVIADSTMASATALLVGATVVGVLLADFSGTRRTPADVAGRPR